MIWKSIALTNLTDTNLCALTQVQLDRLDELVCTIKYSTFCTIKSRNDMKAVERMKIKALII